MSALAEISILTGGVLAMLYGATALWPTRGRRALLALPRSRGAAMVLMLADFAWAFWLLSRTPMGQFEWARPPLYVALPVLLIVIVLFNDDLLAVRALGGLFILLPAPMLDAARWHASGWRYAIIVLAYLLVIKGVALLLSPHLYRRTLKRLPPGRTAWRVMGCAGAALGLLFLGLGLWRF